MSHHIILIVQLCEPPKDHKAEQSDHPKWSFWQTKTPQLSWQAKRQPLPNKRVEKAQVVKQ